MNNTCEINLMECFEKKQTKYITNNRKK